MPLIVVVYIVITYGDAVVPAPDLLYTSMHLLGSVAVFEPKILKFMSFASNISSLVLGILSSDAGDVETLRNLTQYVVSLCSTTFDKNLKVYMQFVVDIGVPLRANGNDVGSFPSNITHHMLAFVLVILFA